MFDEDPGRRSRELVTMPRNLRAASYVLKRTSSSSPLLPCTPIVPAASLLSVNFETRALCTRSDRNAIAADDDIVESLSIACARLPFLQIPSFNYYLISRVGIVAESRRIRSPEINYLGFHAMLNAIDKEKRESLLILRRCVIVALSVIDRVDIFVSLNFVKDK